MGDGGGKGWEWSASFRPRLPSPDSWLLSSSSSASLLLPPPSPRPSLSEDWALHEDYAATAFFSPSFPPLPTSAPLPWSWSHATAPSPSSVLDWDSSVDDQPGLPCYSMSGEAERTGSLLDAASMQWA